MIEHVVLFKFKQETSADECQRMFKKLMELKQHIDQIKDLSVGENFSDRAKGFDAGLVVRFDNKDTLDDYQKHPMHQEVVDRFVKPIVADVLSVDYTFN